MDVAELGDQVDDSVLLAHLHCDGEVGLCLGREEDINSPLLEHGVALLVVNLNHVKLKQQQQQNMTVVWKKKKKKKKREKEWMQQKANLGAGGVPHGEGKEPGWGGRAIHPEVGESRSVTLNRLGDRAVLGVELDRTDNPSLLIFFQEKEEKGT